MAIHLPKDVENSIIAKVHSGLFPSVDAAMTEAARLLLKQLDQGQAGVPPVVSESALQTCKPMWERILERSAAIPDAEWDKLPVDGAEQHDHYIYGTPKRPPSS